MKRKAKSITLTIKKERNPHVGQMRMRPSGAHEKPYKAERGKAKAKLKKEW